MSLVQFDGNPSTAAKPAGQDAFALLMQHARHGQSKDSSTSAVPEQPAAPTDALTLLMQQARSGHAGTAAAASTSRSADFTGTLCMPPSWKILELCTSSVYTVVAGVQLSCMIQHKDALQGHMQLPRLVHSSASTKQFNYIWLLAIFLLNGVSQ